MARPPETREFQDGKPFTLAFGDTGRRTGMTIWYSGLDRRDDGTAAPTFTVDGGKRHPFWSTRRPGVQPAARGLLGDRVISVEKLSADPDPVATLLVTSASLRRPDKGGVIKLSPLEFAALPDGTLLTLGETSATGKGAPSLTIKARFKGDDDEDSRDLPTSGEVVSWHEFLFAVVDAAEGGAVRLRCWRPEATRHAFVLARPFTLYPQETAVGPGGLSLRLAGFGHKIKMDRSDLPFAEIEARRGAETASVRLMFEGTQTATTHFAGYEIRGTARNPGPPHGADRALTLEVVRSPTD